MTRIPDPCRCGHAASSHRDGSYCMYCSKCSGYDPVEKSCDYCGRTRDDRGRPFVLTVGADGRRLCPTHVAEAVVSAKRVPGECACCGASRGAVEWAGSRCALCKRSVCGACASGRWPESSPWKWTVCKDCMGTERYTCAHEFRESVEHRRTESAYLHCARCGLWCRVGLMWHRGFGRRQWMDWPPEPLTREPELHKARSDYGT